MMYLIGNWKMNPSSKTEAINLASEIAGELQKPDRKDFMIGLTPPVIYLEEMRRSMPSYVQVGAQDSFWEREGAYNGEISPAQLKDYGVDYVILGHSERRVYLNETDKQINRKINCALGEGLDIVLCVGEPSEVRSEGARASKSYVEKQLTEDLDDIRSEEIDEMIIAYEPIWAISGFEGSRAATPEDAEEMISFIKNLIQDECDANPSVIYGGSSDSGNVESFVSQSSIDGCLPGSASLRPKDFTQMVNIMSDLHE